MRAGDDIICADGFSGVSVFFFKQKTAYEIQGDWEFRRVLFRSLLTQFKGSVSAEHGIGLDKKSYLNLCRTEAEIHVMKSIKTAIDPRGLMNPGKIFA